jgi:hypothetical protein
MLTETSLAELASRPARMECGRPVSLLRAKSLAHGALQPAYNAAAPGRFNLGSNRSAQGGSGCKWQQPGTQFQKARGPAVTPDLSLLAHDLPGC